MRCMSAHVRIDGSGQRMTVSCREGEDESETAGTRTGECNYKSHALPAECLDIVADVLG